MTSLDKFMLFIAPPAVMVFALIEAIVLSRRQRYDWKAFGVSVVDLIARIAIGIGLPLSIATPLVRLAFQHRLMTLQPVGWTAVLLLFVGPSSISLRRFASARSASSPVRCCSSYR